MSPNLEPSHFTSYALGELNAADSAKVEAYLNDHPEARQEVEGLQSLATLLSAELQSETMPGLDPARRAEIEALSGASPRRSFFARLDARPFAAAAAIIMALGGALSFGLGGPDQEPLGSERSALDGKPQRDDQYAAEKDHFDQLADRVLKIDTSFEESKEATTVETLLAKEIERARARFNLGTSEDLLALINNAAEPKLPVSESDRSANNDAIGLGGGAGGNAAPGEAGRRSTTAVKTEGPAGSSPVIAGGGYRGAAQGAGTSGGYSPTGASSPAGPGSPGPDAPGAPGSGKSPGTKKAAGLADSKRADFSKNAPAPRPGVVDESHRAEEKSKSVTEDPNLLPTDKPHDGMVAAKNAELAAKDDSVRLLTEANASKEELLNLQKEALRKSVDAVDSRYAGFVAPETKELRDRLAKLSAEGPEAAEKQVEEIARRVHELEATGLERRRKYEDEVRRRSGEDYASVIEQPFKMTTTEPLSTIGLDIDTASYANVRRYLQSGQWPPRDAVRVDEMVNYFNYHDAAPEGEENLAIHAEVSACPWNLENRLLRVAFKAKEISADERGATNLVFLVDVSGSMRNSNKLPLLKEGLKALTRELKEDDSVAIVTYASGVRVALEPTYGNDQAAIINVLDSLNAGGSTNGAGGIQMAYEMAQRHFVEGGTNRVLLCTDGDFNVGVSNTDELGRMITEKAKSGVFLSVLGFGTGNIKDGRMQAIANQGNGHYAYIDSSREAQKVLVEELSGTLVTVAKDAKLQIEFSPAEVSSWRLLGYSARILQAQDFNDDTKDAGEIGAGHSVIALYELEPAHKGADGRPAVDPLKYQKTTVVTPGAPGEIASVRLRYKLPDAEESRLRSLVVMDAGQHYGAASADFKLSASVALFGMLLSRSEYVGQTGLAAALELAEESINSANDQKGWRREFTSLIRKAIEIRNRENPGSQDR